jgi:hypothetical protein
VGGDRPRSGASKPIEALGQALAPTLGRARVDVVAQLTASPPWLAAELRAARSRVLLVIDQLEEVWTIAPAADRGVFFAIVASLALSAGSGARSGDDRSDFLGRLEDMGDLAGARAARAGRPAADGTRGATEGRSASPRGDGAVTDRAGARRAPRRSARKGARLPLLEFALGELYARREATTQTIGIADLEALGGVEGALATHADAALARLPDVQRREARRLLLALVTTERTRARREERDLAEGPSRRPVPRNGPTRGHARRARRARRCTPRRRRRGRARRGLRGRARGAPFGMARAAHVARRGVGCPRDRRAPSPRCGRVGARWTDRRGALRRTPAHGARPARGTVLRPGARRRGVRAREPAGGAASSHASLRAAHRCAGDRAAPGARGRLRNPLERAAAGSRVRGGAPRRGRSRHPRASGPRRKGRCRAQGRLRPLRRRRHAGRRLSVE